jgi:hypothetical protein
MQRPWVRDEGMLTLDTALSSSLECFTLWFSRSVS